jgi:Na+-driven multidrug efflux pump
VELAIVAGWTHLNGEKNPFIRGAYRSMHVPKWLLKGILQKGMPIMANEFLWSSGTAMLNQCYSVRGLDVVAAMNITSTLRNLTSVVFLSMGSVTAIIIGQMLGANKPEQQVRDTSNKLLAGTVLSCVVFGGLTAALSGAFPGFYNTTPEVRSMAAALICVVAVVMPIQGFTQVTYFTLRAGGKSFITFMFDAGFMWIVSVPLAYIFSRFTDVPIVVLYAICLGSELIKCGLGALMLKSGVWIQNLTKH